VLSRLCSHGMQRQNALAAAVNVATRNNHVPVVHALLEAGAGADGLVRHCQTRSPICVAAMQDCVECAALLLRAKAAIARALEDAAEHGSLTIVRLLLQVPGQTQRHLNASLHQAARSGHADICRVLCAAKAGVNDAQDDGSSALFGAVALQKMNVVHTLLECKACANTFMPLWAAVDNGSFAMVRVLLKHKADVQYRETFEGAVLSQAVLRRNVRMVRLLLAAKASANTSFTIAESTELVLHAAASYGHVGMLRLLLQCKANPNARSSWNGGDATPLSYALENNHDAAAQVLCSFGALPETH